MRGVLLAVCVVLVAGLLPPAQARAADFAINLELSAGKESKKAQTSSEPGVDKTKPRPVLTVQAGKLIRAQWQVIRTAKNGDAKDVLIHFFVVRQAQVGQESVPKLDKDVAAENAMTMDFQPQDKARGELEFRIDRPGAYLVRAETRDADGKQEFFAALDLVIP